ncbi:MAG: phosphoribosylamine--glycine ligase [Chthoniobacterales bacterium]|nr:phosphoribosylamine--glycine ligase [Chthoniobacterales bacterium]
MKLLIIGSGGREHALLWKLKQSPRVTELYCAPGNAGTAEVATNLPIDVMDFPALLQAAQSHQIDLTIVGPDAPLAAGVVDFFEAAGERIFGPTASAARLESSKSFAKEFMKRHQIPTAASETFSDLKQAVAYAHAAAYPLVLKADGLALGKGVVIANDAEEAVRVLHQFMEEKIFGEAGMTVVIEEFLSGKECSLHALIDGKHYLLFPDARDHKKIFDGDRGLNTGGMGTISPSGILTPALEEQIHKTILRPFLRGLAAEKLLFRGMLFPGLMITPAGPKVLEFNCRFGDPETQVLMKRLESDLLPLLEATLDGTLDQQQPVWDECTALCVILAAAGYPGPVEKGVAIAGIETAQNSDSETMVFHAGTEKRNGRLQTNGGRVLGVTTLGANAQAARSKAYAATDFIFFEGKQYRRDIGASQIF